MKTKILDFADDPRFIEGVYNYCDRWCERCPFTSRCMLYDMEEENRDEPASHVINSDAFWKRLAAIFKQTHEMIARMAAEQGVDLDSIDSESVMEEENRQRAKSESNPLSQSAAQYVKLVNEWFEREYPASERERDADPTRTDLPLVDFDAQDLASDIQDAIEVIRWYQFQIAVKIIRGLMGDESVEDDKLEGVRQRDSDGSIKVALIGMERSISAWGKLSELLPERAGGILPMMLHLEQLRRGTEQAFPNANSFVRPGFDEAPDRFVS